MNVIGILLFNNFSLHTYFLPFQQLNISPKRVIRIQIYAFFITIPRQSLDNRETYSRASKISIEARKIVTRIKSTKPPESPG